MKKLLVFVVALLCMMSLIGCSQSSNLHKFDATILEIHDGYFLVEPCAGMQELNSADKITVSTQNSDASIEWQVGDLVQITYDGVILETYPARLNRVYKVERATPTND